MLIQVKKPIKNKIVHIRCDEEQLKLLEAMAKKEGYKLSTWILFAALNFKKPK